MIVGEAHVVVRAITNSVGPEIRRAFQGRDIDRIGDDTGRRIGDGIGRGLSRGRGGGSGFFSGLAAQSESARQEFDNLIRLSYTLGPAMAGLAGAVSSLIGAFAGLASTVAGAIPALAAIPALIANIGIAGLTLKLAFAGVGNAISAGMKQAVGSAGGASAATRDLTAELRRLKDAEKAYAKAVADREKTLARASEERDRALTRLAEQQEASAQRLAQAQQDVTAAMADGTERVNEATIRLADVEREAAQDIYDAKKKVYEAQLNLNEAYATAREEIQQLKFEAEDAALGEKKAALALEKARETLLRVQDLPPNSRARREAELAFAQADLNYRKAIDKNKDLQKEQDRINQEGVDGTKTVQDAKKRLNDAIESQVRTEADAARSIADAQNDLAKAQIDAANRVAKAQADAAQAQIEFDRDQRDAKWALIDIERRFADEQRAQNEAVAQAKKNLKRAEEDLAKARKKAYGGASGGANAYQQALAKLSPEQRKFVEYMVNTFMPAIKDLQEASAKEFFPRLIPALENLRTNLFPTLIPLLTATGGELGKIAQNVSTSLTSPQVIDNIKAIWDSVNTKILPSASIIVSNAITIVSQVIAAAQPLVERFVGWIEGISTGWKNIFSTKEGQSELQILLNRAGSIASEIGGIIGDVLSGLGNIVKSQMSPDSGGYVMLRFFRDAAAAFKDFTGSPEGIARIEDFFKNTAENAKPILGFVGDLVKEFLKLGENPNIGPFFQSLRDANIAKTVGDLANTMLDAGPAIADFVKNFIGFVKSTTDSGAISTFWQTLSTILGTLRDIFQSPTMQQILPIIGSIAAAGVALRTAWGPARTVILAIANPLIMVVNALSRFGPVARLIEIVRFNFSAFVALFGAGPVAAVVAIIAGIVLAFIAMWRESEKFREAIQKLISGVVDKAVKIFNDLRAKLDEALEPLGGMEGVVNALRAAFKWLGDILGTYVIPFIEAGLKNALDIIGAVLGTVIDTIGKLIRAFQKIWEGISTGDITKVFEGVRDAILAPFEALWSNLVDLFVNIWNNVVEAVKSVLGIASPSTVFTDIATAILDAIVNVLTFIPQKFIEFFTAAWTGVTNFISNTIIPFLGGLGVTVGTALVDLWKSLVSLLSTAWEKVKTFFTVTVAGWLGTLGDKVKGWIVRAWDGLTSVLSTAWTAVKTFFTGTAAGWLRGLGATIKGWLRGAWDGITDVLGTAWDKVTEFFSAEGTVGKFILGLKEKISRWAGSMWDGLKSGLSGVVATIKGWLNNLRGPVNTLIGGANKIVGVLSLGQAQIPLIPPLAEGGIVYPKMGGTIARIAEAGRPERVEPLDPDGLSKRDKAMIAYMGGGAGGATINVYATPGMDEVQLAKIVSREISFMMRKGSV